MISQIIRKEVLENILSLRFMLSLLLAIVLFATSAFVFIGKYKQQSQDYWEETNKSLENFSKQTILGPVTLGDKVDLQTYFLWWESPTSLDTV